MKNEQQRSRRDRKSGIWCLKIRVLIKLSRKLWPIPVRKILKTVGWLLWQTSWHLPQLTLWKTFCAMDPCPHYNGAITILKCKGSLYDFKSDFLNSKWQVLLSMQCSSVIFNTRNQGLRTFILQLKTTLLYCKYTYC